MMNLDLVNVMSDTHFGHDNILKPEYDNRGAVFADLQEHDSRIIQNTVDRVRPGSHLWHIGDIAWPKPTSALPFLEAMKKHKVRLHLVLGNHDDKVAKQFKEYFATIDHAAYFHLDNERFFFSHYACRTWRGSNRGSYHVHGHSHNMLPRLGRSLDACVLALDWGPKPLSWVVNELVHEGPTMHHPAGPNNPRPQQPDAT